MVIIGCINVLHNETDCTYSSLPFSDWCPVCAHAVKPRDYSHDRGDILYRCDACSTTVDKFSSTPGNNTYRFDVQEECVRWDRNPFEREYWMVCGACRFTERLREMREQRAMQKWYEEEQKWLASGGQDLIDGEPYTPMM